MRTPNGTIVLNLKAYLRSQNAVLFASDLGHHRGFYISYDVSGKLFHVFSNLRMHNHVR